MNEKLSKRLEVVYWKDVRKSVNLVDPELSAIIDQFDLAKKYPLIKARYYYGDKILKKREVQVPFDHNKVVPLKHSDISKKIQEELGYSSCPIGLILTKTVEVSFEDNDHSVPFRLFSAGDLFGFWEVFDPPPSEFVKNMWNLSAGARTVFMLPKISDATSHNRLKRHFGIPAYPPKSLFDHQKIFVELASHQSNKTDNWYCDILFFTDNWLKNNQETIGHLKLQNYWLKRAWKTSYNSRNQISYDIAWEYFSKEVARRNYKPRASTISIIKHLLNIRQGVFPGFTPALENETALPVNLIQKIYREIYSLKQYSPIIMQPYHLKEKERAVYYSLSLPAQMEHTALIKNSSNIMSEIRELRMLMQILVNTMKEKNANYSFFHSEEDQFGEIQSSSNLIKEDIYLSSAQENNKAFCENSSFWRGCIKIKLI